MKKIGTVTHYYSKIKVAAIELTDNLEIGDKILFIRGGEELFEQVVDSLQIEHKDVNKAGKNDEVGIKTMQDVKEGSEVYKIS